MWIEWLYVIFVVLSNLLVTSGHVDIIMELPRLSPGACFITLLDQQRSLSGCTANSCSQVSDGRAESNIYIYILTEFEISHLTRSCVIDALF